MSFVQYTKLAFFVLGILFSPLHEKQGCKAYFDVIHSGTLAVESFVFECGDSEGEYAFYGVGGDGSRSLLFTIVPEQGEGMRFALKSPKNGSSIDIDLTEYVKDIKNSTFIWNGEQRKLLEFSSGNPIIVHKAGTALYLQSKEFPDLIFCIHE
ncbi:MAG: hypothetical protein P8107_04920 [Spirochaetia bacterium]